MELGARLLRTLVRAVAILTAVVAGAVTLSLVSAGPPDRDPQPSQVRTGESPGTAPCLSASASSAEVAVGAARIGDDFAPTTAPGETFSTFSSSVQEKSGALVTVPPAPSADARGYLPQEFELTEIDQQGPGFLVSGVAVVDDEDSHAIGHCSGDAAPEHPLELLKPPQ